MGSPGASPWADLRPFDPTAFRMSLDSLLSCTGEWVGTSALHDPDTGVPDRSPSEATVTPLLSGRFVRVDYTWMHRGTPQAGSILVGMDPLTQRHTAHWIDSWHMGPAVMACSGSVNASTFSVRGSYAAPPGPDWGWRIDLAPEGGQTLRVTMYNVAPEGHDELAVEADYTRSEG